MLLNFPSCILVTPSLWAESWAQSQKGSLWYTAPSFLSSAKCHVCIAKSESVCFMGIKYWIASAEGTDTILQETGLLNTKLSELIVDVCFSWIFIFFCNNGISPLFLFLCSPCNNSLCFPPAPNVPVFNTTLFTSKQVRRKFAHLLCR